MSVFISPDLITIIGLIVKCIFLSHRLRHKILDALQGNEIGATMDPTKCARNYKLGSVEGNMIFEGTSYLPKEVMLEMTLKAFGYEMDMMEVNMLCHETYKDEFRWVSRCN